jgi:hypothetical protein
MGKALEGSEKKEESFVYWAYKNNIPLFSVPLHDGALGDHLYFFRKDHPDFVVDMVNDVEELYDKVLLEAGMDRASKIILTLPKTETNILITLTAKDINPKIEVYSRAENENLIKKLKKAGAKIVIIPEVLAGDEIVKDLKL